ncbi:hypothetical protein SEA_MAGRITTE_129 [Microbacterium phage Magritte]|nr:hypothetical protein SEA_MAGRITTE_129 [Microbacterium phage Magritte]
MSPELRPWCFEHKGDPASCAAIHEQRAQWEDFEHASLRKGNCPHSGSRLEPRKYDDGPVDPTGDIVSCDICDCFGFQRDDPRLLEGV